MKTTAGCAGLVDHFLHALGHGHVGGQRQHRGSQGLELAHLADGLADRVVRLVPRQPVVPVGALRHRRAPDQHQLGVVVACQPFGDHATDAAQATGDDIDATLAQARHGRGRRLPRSGEVVLPAHAAAPRNDAVARHSEQLAGEVARGLRHVGIGLRAALAVAARHADVGVNEGTAQVRKLARHHGARPERGGLVRVRQRLVADTLRAVGHHREVHAAFHDPGLGQGPRQVEQRIKTMLLVAVEEGRSRAESPVQRDQPGVQDAVRKNFACDQGVDQFLVTGATSLGRERVR